MEYKGVLVIAEGCGSEIHRVSYELLNKGRELSTRLGSKLSCVILGNEGMNVEELCYRGADKVFYMKDESFGEPEEYLFKDNLINFIREHKPEIVLIGATNFGRSLGPRIAAALRTGLTADCTDLRIDEEGRLIQIRPAFSNNIFAHIKTVTYPQMATIRYKEFGEAEREEKREVDIEVLKPYTNKTDKSHVTHVYNEDNFDITQAVSGG